MNKHLLAIALQLAASGADAYATHHNAQQLSFHEQNPLARTFVTHGTPLLATYFVAQTGAKLYAVHWLREHRHTQRADALAIAGIADNAVGAVRSR